MEFMVIDQGLVESKDLLADIHVRFEHQNRLIRVFFEILDFLYVAKFELALAKGPDFMLGFDISDERNAFVKLRQQGRPHPNIIGYYGSFIRDGTYNVILEYADKGNLNDYMTNTDEPRSISDIMMFWTRFFDVLQGLVQIHGTPGHISGLPSLLGWHHDLAPDNILVVSKGDGSHFDCDFKIAGLDLAHFRRHLESSQRATGEDRHASNAYCRPFMLA
ncbi:MAG: hypothetical protein Q9203_001666 [Teloschistes exilis]